MMNCELYLIQVNMDGPVKIGRSTSTEKRLRSLQTGNPLGLRVAEIYTLSSEDAAEAEKGLHYELAHRRMCGEWFNLSVDLLKEYVPDYFRANGIDFIVGEG